MDKPDNKRVIRLLHESLCKSRERKYSTKGSRYFKTDLYISRTMSIDEGVHLTTIKTKHTEIKLTIHTHSPDKPSTHRRVTIEFTSLDKIYERIFTIELPKYASNLRYYHWLSESITKVQNEYQPVL